MRKLYFIVALFSICGSAQIVNIPDANFKNALVNTLCVSQDVFSAPTTDADTNDDGEIQLLEALAVEYLIISNNELTSVDGIENFQNLKKLDCSFNQLSSLNISSLPSLYSLDCSNNVLTSLILNVFGGNMETASYLDCSYNLLTDISLPANYYNEVFIRYNPLINIDLSLVDYVYQIIIGNLPFLTHLELTGTGIVWYLTVLNCPLLTSADFVKGPTERIGIINTGLSSVDLSKRDVDYIDIHGNVNLESINIKNGYSFDPQNQSLGFENNPQLKYVCYDDLSFWITVFELELISEAFYVANAVDPGVMITPYCSFSPGGRYNIIEGNLSYNCSETNINVANAQLKLTGQGTSTTSTNSTGDYFFYGFYGNSTVTPQFENPYFTVSPPSYTFNFTSYGNNETANFCVTPNGVHPDLEVSMVSTIPARPGFDAKYKIVYKNKGTETLSGSVSLDFEDDVMDLVSSEPAVSMQSDNHLSWDFSGLAPFESREITVTMNINSPVETPAVNIDNELTFNVTGMSGADETPADNVFGYDQIVVGSFDPNDKAVSKASISPDETDEYLYYTVRFQNTGTFEAENVVVRDLLSDKLDLSTFEMVSGSHPYRSSLALGHIPGQYLEGNKLEIFFQGIGLPASADDEPGSHGYVTFKIMPKSSVVLGDIIENNAGIYFDYNSPVLTNTVSTTVSQLATTKFETESIGIYPNPANQLVTVSVTSGKMKDISIYNSLGQLLKRLSGGDKKSTSIDISELNGGTYFVKIASDKGTFSKKLIKL